MAKRKSFADDGWAIWITGDDTSTFYLNEWVNPQGKSYVDVSVRIRGVKGTRNLNLYIPFVVEKTEVEENPFRNLEGEISVLLSRMGISASIKGYHFIRKAVILALEDEEALVGITKGLYPDIAKCYKTSASKVERAIRHAIESAWKKNGPQIYFEVAGYLPSEKPTNGQFLSALSEYFRLHEERPKKIS